MGLATVMGVKTKTRKTNSNAGFSMVELLMATSLSSILLLCGCTVLMNSYSGLGRQATGLELQRDATHVMELISAEARAASSDKVTASTGSLEVESPNGDLVTLYQSGDDLLFDPGTGTPLTIVRNCVSSFTVNASLHSLHAHLVLECDGQEVEVSNRISFRSGRWGSQ